MAVSTLLGPLERASLNYWSYFAISSILPLFSLYFFLLSLHLFSPFASLTFYFILPVFYNICVSTLSPVDFGVLGCNYL
jgi:hypothetical protein